jgi:ribosome-binding protein aMBF1 (putative translation factor)
MKKVVYTVSKTLGKKLSQARAAKELTRAELAKQISERESVVGGFENGTAIFNGTVLQKLNRALGTKFKKTD